MDCTCTYVWRLKARKEGEQASCPKQRGRLGQEDTAKRALGPSTVSPSTGSQGKDPICLSRLPIPAGRGAPEIKVNTRRPGGFELRYASRSIFQSSHSCKASDQQV